MLFFADVSIYLTVCFSGDVLYPPTSTRLFLG